MSSSFGGVRRIGQLHNKRRRPVENSNGTEKKKRKLIKKGDVIKRTSTGQWIEEALSKNLIQTQRAEKGVIRCSGIGEGARVLAMKYAGIFEEVIELPSLRYMNNGTYGHERWETHLKDAGILHSSETQIPSHPDLPLRGQFDFVIKNSKGEKFLLELKTTNINKWTSMSEPDSMHISQWAIYSDRLQIENGFIIYENRDSLTPKYFPISRSGADINIYSLSGILMKTLEGFVNDTYDRVRFAIWCVEHDAFPSEECEPCERWGCKQPDKCKEFQKTKQLISFTAWKRGLWS